MDSPDPQAIIEAIGKLPVIVAVCLAVVAFLAFCVALYWRHHDKVELAKAEELRKVESAKAEARLEAEKRKRAEKHAEAINNLATAVRSLCSVSERLERCVIENTEVIRTNVKGLINHNDTRKIIDREIYNVCRETIYAFQVSLKANHFRNREADVEVKMKRAVANIFDRSLDQLKSLNLAIDAGLFFQTQHTDKGATRYLLVDTIWDAMVPLYRDPIDYSDDDDTKARNEEISGKIQSVFRDEQQAGHRRADSTYRNDLEDTSAPLSKKHRTPAPVI